MRLGQLARKLAIRPVVIVDFLASRNIQIEEGGNTRLEDHHVEMILERFPSPEQAPIRPPVEMVPEEPRDLEIKSVPEIEVSDQPTVEEEKIEVIKAQKVELTGLKVLGKIDLPEPRKAEPKLEEQENSATPEIEKKPFQTSKKPYPQRRDRPNPGSTRKNPIALQREREVMEARKKREEELEQEKEKRTLHYLKKVNVAQPTKATKIIHKEPDETEPIVVAKVPRTWWGRFIKWLNT